MTKRANGEGSVRLRPDGRWEARLRRGVGEPRQTIYGKTQAEVVRKLREAGTAHEHGEAPVSAKLTTGEFLDDWLEAAGPSLRPRTRASYEQAVRLHLKPYLGRIPLSKLQAQHVQRVYRRLLDDGLAAKTVWNTHGALHRALAQAVRWGAIHANPVDKVDPPRKPRAEMHFLDAKQIRAVLGAADHDPLRALWYLALTTGMREGELLGLRWPQVSLDAASLAVTETLVRLKGEYVRGEPKTARSRRLVHLSAHAVEALRQHERQAKERALATGRPYERDGFVFTRADGRPLAVTSTLKSWYRLLGRAGVPRVRFHDARHSVASLALSSGTHPKLVSELLGHSTTSMTLDTYSHATAGAHRQAAAVMDELLFAGGGQAGGQNAESGQS